MAVKKLMISIFLISLLKTDPIGYLLVSEGLCGPMWKLSAV
jgi:hypothetical protein